MGIFKRMNDIISANINDLIDGFEDPEKMLKQAVREIETALGQAMDGAAKVIANEKRLAKQLADWRSQATHWKHRAEQAVNRNDDDAARHALVRKRECEQLAAALEDQRAAAEHAARRLRRQIEAMRVRLAEARRKMITLAARKHAAEARKQFTSGVAAATFDHTAFGRFDRLCDSIEQSEAEADALLELSGDAFEDDINTCDRVEVDVELAALKHELQQR